MTYPFLPRMQPGNNGETVSHHHILYMSLLEVAETRGTWGNSIAMWSYSKIIILINRTTTMKKKPFAIFKKLFKIEANRPIQRTTYHIEAESLNIH